MSESERIVETMAVHAAMQLHRLILLTITAQTDSF